MRNKILQYLLIFISLIALYLFVSDMNKSEAFAASQERMSKRVDTLKDSIAQLVVEQTDNAYFSLAFNRDAQQAHPDFSPEELQNIIEDYILLSNDNPKETPYCLLWDLTGLLTKSTWSIINGFSLILPMDPSGVMPYSYTR